MGIAKAAICTRGYLAAVRVDGLFLMLELMRFAHEVRNPIGLKSPSGTQLNSKEIAMAKQLIDSLTTEWNPLKDEDRY